MQKETRLIQLTYTKYIYFPFMIRISNIFKLIYHVLFSVVSDTPYVPGSFSSKAKSKFFSSAGPSLLASSFDKSVLQVNRFCYFILSPTPAKTSNTLSHYIASDNLPYIIYVTFIDVCVCVYLCCPPFFRLNLYKLIFLFKYRRHCNDSKERCRKFNFSLYGWV